MASDFKCHMPHTRVKGFDEFFFDFLRIPFWIIRSFLYFLGHPDIGTAIIKCFEYLNGEKHILDPGLKHILDPGVKCILNHQLYP